MTRARPVDAAVAALATISVMLPLTTLFQPDSFLWPSIVMVLVIAVVGVAARIVVEPGWAVVTCQALAGFVTAVLMLGRGHLWFGLPTIDMFQAWNRVLVDAMATIQNYSAPAPTTRGVIVGVSLGLGVVAVLVDATAVTFRSPVLAGLPLLTAYLVSAANSGVGLGVVWFVTAAVCWVVMVGRQGVSTFRGWGNPIPLDRPERQLGDQALSLRFTSAGRRLAVGCITLAVLLPMALPHLPARFLLDGLGRNPGGVGVGDSMQLNSTLDVSRSLQNQSQGAVLTYRSNAAATEPLRVDILTAYAFGRWTTPDTDPSPDGSLPNPPDGLTEAVTRSRARIVVTDNTVAAPQLAAPYPSVDVALGRTKWSATSTGGIRPERRVSSYRVDYLTVSPTEEQLRAATTASLSYGSIDPAFLDVDSGSRDTVRAILDRIVPVGADPITTARTIQNYLHGPDFTYSLTLAQPTAADRGNALRAFLRTKQGYCVQYATAMIMMARASGIPARMAIGFLPGHLLANGSYVVRASDAHAWPELYFSGIGWLRFEPTPSSRAGTTPVYSSAPLPSASTAPSTGPTASAPVGPTAAPRRVDNQQDRAGAAARSSTPVRLWQGVQDLPAWAWFGLVVILGLLSTLLVPAAAAVRRRRDLASADDDADRAEVRWQDLIGRVADLGIRPPPGATPRQAGRFVSVSSHLAREDVDRLKSVVATVETARYAPPGTAVDDVAEPARQVIEAVGRTRPRYERLRARLLPSDGVDQLRTMRRRLGQAPRDAVARMRAARDHR